MIHCQEALLKSAVGHIAAYAEAHPDAASYYGGIDALAPLSLQGASLRNELDFLQEVDRILSVITTIIVHPHILNARETVIVRAEQAYGITPEMFSDTVRDQKLWKEKRGVMTPSEVYYFRNVDELANYENRFIVHLLDAISAQLASDTKALDTLIGTVRRGALTEEHSQLEALYRGLGALSKKLRRIRATQFYRIVSKSNTRFARVEATNLFKHDRAYGACYRFYLRNMTYAGDEARADDMAVYFSTRLLLALKTLGYELIGEDHVCDEALQMLSMTFENANFFVALERAEEYGGVYVLVRPKAAEGGHAARNLLVFDPTPDFSQTGKELERLRASGAAVDAVNLWDVAYVEDAVQPLGMRGTDENGLLLHYLKDKTRLQKGSRQIYETHCPACGGRDVSAERDRFRCAACKTEYIFLGEGIWFPKLRKP